MKLIDADDFRRRAQEVYPEYWEDVIDEMPAVDAVEVVRCKDCCYYNGNMSYCDIDHYAVSDGYCHNGVRHVDA